MKILVFEYITGGGFNKQELPDSLASEGRLMLNALLDNLTRLNSFDVTVMMDWRLSESINIPGVNIVAIEPEHDLSAELARLIAQSDLVWPIAPEFDRILETVCRTVEALGKTLLTSPAEAVVLAGNKFKTYQRLNQHQISAVPTRMLDKTVLNGGLNTSGEWMVKPVDGVGCADSFVVADPQDLERLAEFKDKYIIQPHLQGAKTSLSCLFRQGQCWPICANSQQFELLDWQYRLTGILVNDQDVNVNRQLAGEIARAFPELWGYVGIDLIETATQTWVLEINPRLTTSYAGIYEALGINIAEMVLQLLSGEPLLIPRCNKAVTVRAHAG